MSKRTLHGFFGGGGGGKKAKSSSAASANASADGPKPVFICCPGAGGVLPRDGTLESQLGRLGRVVVIPKSSGYNGKVGCTVGSKGSLNANLRIITDAVQREVNDASVTASTPIVLVGQSFGCRAIVHWMSANHEVRKHPSIPTSWTATPSNYDALRGRIAAILCFGYPLDHHQQDRSAALKGLPSDVRAMFVMGTSDKQSLGDGLSQSKFEGVLNATSATTSIIWVDRGGHSPPNSSKWTGAGLNTKIKMFLGRAPFAGAGKTLGTGADDGAEDGGGKKKAAATPEDVRAKRLAALSTSGGGMEKKAGGDNDDDDDDVVVIDDDDADEKKSDK